MKYKLNITYIQGAQDNEVEKLIYSIYSCTRCTFLKFYMYQNPCQLCYI